MKRFSSDLYCVFILLQVFYFIQLGARHGDSLDFPRKGERSLGLGSLTLPIDFELGAPLELELSEEESLDKTIDDSDNDDSNQDLAPKSEEIENTNQKSKVGRCSI